ncbi:sensor histidine kinase [Brachybacterium sp. DNPG3]
MDRIGAARRLAAAEGAAASCSEDRRALSPRGLTQALISSGAVWYTAPSLLFLLLVIIPAFWFDNPLQSAAIILVALAYGTMFLYTPGIRSYRPRVAVGWLAVMWVLLALLALLIRENVVYMVMYAVISHAVALPWRIGRLCVLPVAVLFSVPALLLDQPTAIVLAVVGVVMSLGIGYSIDQEILRERLAAAEQRNAVLAVAAERERIGRDLHDILGHSLTTITVSAQLARRLLDADPEAARAQIEEIERLSRQSLADVRATASGMQQVRAASEIASARSVLAAAGIEADVPAALPELDDECAELLGYVIREGVTNAVRHSRATRCTIRLEADRVVIADDGVGFRADRARTGLAGLEARLAEHGGELRIASGPEGTSLTAILPAADGTARPSAAASAAPSADDGPASEGVLR